MKICWDNLEGIRMTSTGTFLKGNNSFVEVESCVKCGQSFLTNKYNPSTFCCRACALVERKFSAETKRKMSAAWKNRPPISDETRKKQSLARKGLLCGKKNGMYGKTHTKKVKRKMSERLKGNTYRLGIPHTEDTKGHLSIINLGKLNGNWKGGISCEPYCSDWTKEHKEYIRERDGNKCLNPDCWCGDDVLTVHHIDYDKKNCNPDNLITVCRSCNSRANKDRGWHKAWYQAIIHKRYGGK